MSYINPKTDYKDGEILYGVDLNATNEVIKAGVDDNFDRIKGLDSTKQDVIDNSNKLDYSLLDNTPYIPNKLSDLTNDNNTVSDANYVHTDNNYTTSEKNRLSGIEAGAQVNVIEEIEINGNSASISNKKASININVPTKLSDLTNDNNTVTDSSYVHTDNNYTSSEKTKLAGIATGAEVNDIKSITVDSIPVIPDSNKNVNISVPSKTSDLQNDSGYLTAEYHDSSKQDTLVSGTNIKTINNQSILGSGNITIQGSGGSGVWGAITGDIEDQTDLMGKFTQFEETVASELSGKQNTLVSGTNIKTINNTSILGEGNISISGGGTSDYTDLTNKPQINGVTLSGNKSLSDLGIQPKIDSNNKLPYSNISGTPTIPTKLSDLTNDNNTVTDSSYVHTDNNYTTAEKNKLAGVDNIIVVGSESSATSQTELIIESTDFDVQNSEPDYYSTSEVKTNKVWKDNKPIYRKIIDIPGTTFNYQGVTNISLDIQNIETLTDYKTIFVHGVNIENGNYYTSSTDKFRTWISQKSKIYIDCYVTETAVNNNLTITLEYTKTTD